MKIRLLAPAILAFLASRADAQAKSPASPALGTWRGTSLCLVRPSRCNDETVVYRITQLKTADSVAIDARKIVRGEEEEMGVLTCVAGAGAKVTCTMPQGVWHFTVKGDSLVGELRVEGNVKFRDVRTARAQK